MIKLILAGAALAAILFLVQGRAVAGPVFAGPDDIDRTRSLADHIRPDRTLHIIFVHGMRAFDSGASVPLAQLMEQRLGFSAQFKP